MTLLLIDIGNTAVKAAVRSSVASVPRPLWRVPADRAMVAQDVALGLRNALAGQPIERAAVVSVVPELDGVIAEAVFHATGVTPLCAGSPALPWPNLPGIAEPSRVGADRLCNIVAARAMSQEQAMLIVSLGTATTFDLVDGEGVLMGGAIACGAGLALTALGRSASRLPQLSLEAVADDVVLGRDTGTQMAIGAYVGHLGLLRELIGRMCGTVAGPVQVIATGGHATLFARERGLFDRVEPTLTFQGLARLTDPVGAAPSESRRCLKTSKICCFSRSEVRARSG